MKTISNLAAVVISIVTLLTSCGEEKKVRGRIDYDAIKTELNLNEEQTIKFDATVAKYEDMREAIKADESGDRMARMEKFREVMKKQTEETITFLTKEQGAKFTELSKKFSRGRSGYSDEFIAKLNTELGLDSTQQVMLVAVNYAFEKSYVNAHDYYHGNPEAAKEYWNKFDVERKKTLEKVFTDEQFIQFTKLAQEELFAGEHGGERKK